MIKNTYETQLKAARIDLSMIIPAYNEEFRLSQNLCALEKCIETAKADSCHADL